MAEIVYHIAQQAPAILLWAELLFPQFRDDGYKAQRPWLLLFSAGVPVSRDYPQPLELFVCHFLALQKGPVLGKQNELPSSN